MMYHRLGGGAFGGGVLLWYYPENGVIKAVAIGVIKLKLSYLAFLDV
jgi:hypothetical protein